MQVPHSPVGMTQPSTQALRGPSGEGGTPEAFGAGIARGLGAVAGAVNDLSTYVQQKRDQTLRFSALEKLSALETQLNTDLVEQSRGYDPTSGADLPVQFNDTFVKRKDEFVASLPPELQEEFSARVAQMAPAYQSKALQYQMETFDDYTRKGVVTAYDNARLSLGTDGSPANLEMQMQILDDYLANTTLTDAEKISLRRTMRAGMEIVSYKSEYKNKQAELGALGAGSAAAAGATELIAEFTNMDPSTTVVMADAAEEIVLKTVPPMVWAALSDPAKAAVLSLVADKLQLPGSVVEAIKSGNTNSVADSIENLGGERRKAEADAARGVVPLKMSELDSNPLYADIPYEDRLAAQKDADLELNEERNAQIQAQTQRNSAMVNALFVGLADGSAGELDIDTLRQMDILRDFDDIEKAHKILEDRIGKTNLVAEGINMLATGATFNPMDDHHKDIANAMIGEQGLNAIDAQNSEYAAEVVVPFVQRTGEIPTSVAGQLMGMVRSNDQAKALWAYDLLSQLQQASPSGFAQRVNEDLAKDVEFWRNSKEYFPPEKLMDMLRGGATQETRVQMEALRKEATSMLSSVTSPDYKKIMSGVVEEMTSQPWFGQAAQSSIPSARRALTSDYQELFVEAYTRYGDINLAKADAKISLQRNWGVTQVGGFALLMKYPPDKMGYPKINDSYDWITHQVREEVGLKDDETFELFSDDQTRAEFERWQREGGQPPSYRVVITDKYGTKRLWNPATWADHKFGETDPRVYFDTKPFAAQIENEWLEKRAELNEKDATKTLQDAIRHQQETGTPVPPELYNDAFRSILPSGGAIMPDPTGVTFTPMGVQ